jgi:hypothetical protein
VLALMTMRGISVSGMNTRRMIRSFGRVGLRSMSTAEAVR